MSLPSREIRETFLRFFEERGHRRIASASLVPDSDPTLMFVNAGMVPFKRLFLGEETRDFVRATTSQKCMRVSGKHNDLENVGRTPRHHTFFEMLGNFSFGDYFKEAAIEYAWKLLTEGVGFKPDDLVISVFRDDDEAYDIWRDRIGIPASRIYRLDEAENFWSMGDTGPCGPCSEIHYDWGQIPGRKDDDPSSDSGRFMEIWNLVFMQFNRDASGAMTPLPKPSIDTGGGLERWAAVLQGVRSSWESDCFTPLDRPRRGARERRPGLASRDRRLAPGRGRPRARARLPDRGRRAAVATPAAATSCAGSCAARRATESSSGRDTPFIYSVADRVIDQMKDAYPVLADRRAYITDRIRREEERFLETLSKGLQLLEGEIGELRAKGSTAASRRDRLQALRHLRLPGRPDGRHPGGSVDEPRPDGLRLRR